MNRISMLDDEISEKERQLASLKRERTRLGGLKPEYLVAETLHGLLCHWNHTDGCSWGYESWDTPDMGHAHKTYYDLAVKVLAWCREKQIDHVDVIDLITILEKR